MNTNINDIPDSIEELLQYKSFRELDNQEKESVLKFLSEKEYEEYRNAIIEIKSDYREIEPNPDIYLNIMNKYKKSVIKSDFKFKKCINLKIPAYSAAASIAIIILSFALFNHNETQYIYKNSIDTVYIQKVVKEAEYITKVIYKERKSNYKDNINVSNELQPSNELDSIKYYNTLNNMNIAINRTPGSSARKDSALMGFLRVAN